MGASTGEVNRQKVLHTCKKEHKNEGGHEDMNGGTAMTECSELGHCKDRRLADAERWGKVLQKLENIDGNIAALWLEIKDQRTGAENDRRATDRDFRNVYFKMGVMSGSISLIVSLIFSMVSK